jgi:hypothetical protein
MIILFYKETQGEKAGRKTKSGKNTLKERGCGYLST